MCRIFEISKEAMCTFLINGAIIVILDCYDVVIVSDRDSHALDKINPRDINLVHYVEGRTTEIALKLKLEREEL